MSIPKEPRQIMINIMYLVLTALLALNVSAEIFNAFKVVDKGLKQSSVSLDASNAALPDVIKTTAKKKPEFQKYADRVDGVRQTSKEFTTYVQGIIDYMIDQSGDQDGSVGEGDYETYQGVTKLKGEKDKDITTRYLVDGDDGMQPVGAELKQKIADARAKFMTFIDENHQATTSLPLKVDDDVDYQNLKDKSKKVMGSV